MVKRTNKIHKFLLMKNWQKEFAEKQITTSNTTNKFGIATYWPPKCSSISNLAKFHKVWHLIVKPINEHKQQHSRISVY